MSLRGDITDFPLTEIVQIIGVSRQSGTLVLDGEISKLSISFRAGKPVQTASANNRYKIGELLLKNREVERRDVIDALLIQKRHTENGDYKRIGNILVEMGIVSPHTMNRYLSDQITESLYDILSEKQGTFEFNPEKRETDSDDLVALDIEELIFQGLREIENKTKIKDTLLSGKTVYEHNDSIVERDAVLLTNEERLVLSVVDGTRQVNDIVGVTDIPSSEIIRILSKLINMSYIESDSTTISN